MVRKISSSKILLLIFCISTLSFSPVSAKLSQSQLEFYAQNNILFYDPTGGYSQYCLSVDTSGGDNVSTLLGFLIESGFSEIAAAGVVGNLQGESGGTVNPKIIEGGRVVDDDFRAWNGGKTYSGGFGIAQWTDSGRVQNLQSFADQNNLPVTSLEAQARFLVQEMANYGLPPEKLNSYSNVREVVHDMVYIYERPADMAGAVSTRTPYAEALLGATPSSSGFGSSVCSSSTWDGNFPEYRQCDPQWGKLNYGRDGINGHDLNSICESGCGPASFAMLATALTGQVITPADTADVAGRAGMHVPGGGSSWLVTSILAEHYNLQYKTIPAGSTEQAIQAINQALSEGWMIHTSGKGGAPFTAGGHYIGIYGISSNGEWLVADSNAGNSSYDPHVVVAGMALGNIKAIK